jgi:hypothetical protein
MGVRVDVDLQEKKPYYKFFLEDDSNGLAVFNDSVILRFLLSCKSDYQNLA